MDDRLQKAERLLLEGETTRAIAVLMREFGLSGTPSALEKLAERLDERLVVRLRAKHLIEVAVVLGMMAATLEEVESVDSAIYLGECAICGFDTLTHGHAINCPVKKSLERYRELMTKGRMAGNGG